MYVFVLLLSVLSLSLFCLLFLFVCLLLFFFLGSLPSNGCVFQDCVGHHHKEEYFRASGGAQAAHGAPGD